MMTRFAQSILGHPGRLAMPIGVYAGLEITGGTIRDIVTDPKAQAAAVLALHERLRTPILLTAMDLSAESEAFGCEIRMSPTEIPTVIGRKVTGPADLKTLPAPKPGDARTAVHLESARLIRKAVVSPVVGCMIGPFSLAGRIFGVSEALEATALEPEIILALLENVVEFQIAYARAFRETGISAVIIAEPAAGLLSPAGLGRFSAPFVKRIVEGAQTWDFAVILHNCGAKLIHLDKVLESGAEIYHFGTPMDIVAALERAAGQVILGGNLDPAAVFLNGTPDSVRTATLALLDATKDHKNYFISSGCDIPPGTPLVNLEAFYKAVADFSGRAHTAYLPS
ncbi:MAG: uroporphyrinogen decarboxylase family protein [Candidatus Aminicenantales bacterium]|jgi:uroporphyrinogen decarboxylase